MSKGQRLRALVNERLTAAAEDIFALFERTIAEYEEELCRSKEENERKQQLLDSVLSPQIELHRQDVQPQTQSPCLDQGNPDSSQIKENSEILSIKKERDLFQEFSCVVKSESEEQSDNDEDWETPAGSSTQVKTEADEDDYSNQDYTEDSDRALFSQLNFESISTNQSLTESSNSAVNNDSCVREEGKEIRKNECYFCKKNFRDKHHLKRHLVVHTGEKPFQCPVCAKCYSHKDTLRSHMALHNWSKKSDEGDQGCSSLTTKTLQPGPGSIESPTKNTPFSCPICLKGFTKSFALRQHILIHTGEKPFSCPVCNKRFSQKVYVRKHMRTHTGEKPFTCLQCNMRFSRKSNLNRHSKVHAQKS